MAVMINGEMRYVGRTLKVRDTYRMDMFCEEVVVLNEKDEVEVLYIHEGDRPEVDATPEVIALVEEQRRQRIAKAKAEREHQKKAELNRNAYLSEDQISQMADAAVSDYEFSCDWNRALEAAAEFSMDEFGITPRLSACRLAVKHAKVRWQAIVHRTIAEAGRINWGDEEAQS